MLRSGLAWKAALSVALAADTVSITVMEIVVTVPVNRALIRRGKGHAAVHAYHR